MISHFRSNGKKPGIILNELGDENVENHLFEGQQGYVEFQYAAGKLRLNKIEQPLGLIPTVVLIDNKLEPEKVDRFYKELTK